MRPVTAVIAAAVALLAAGAAQAAPTIVNINANPSAGTVNAGHVSGNYPYSPVTLSLTAGSYTVSLAGIAGGGLYNAYSVATNGSTPTSYTDAYWQVSLDNVTSAYAAPSVGTFTTASAAYQAYSAANATYSFTLASTQNVYFYVDDASYPYFGDDTGGVSLAVTKNAIPEPATMALVGTALIGLAAIRRRRRAA